MILTNLVPAEELENQTWYIPDLITLAVTFGIFWGCLQLYIQDMEVRIQKQHDQRSELKTNLAKLNPKLARFNELSGNIEHLRQKINSLNEITVSKIQKFKPVILMEILQNIKPKGVWYSTLLNESDTSIIRIAGGAFDSMLIADFISALESTQHQLIDPTDIKTKIFFSDVFLEKVHTAKASTGSEDKPSTTALTDAELEKNVSLEQGSQRFFPEVKDFPTFEISLRYKERQFNKSNIQFTSEEVGKI